MTKIAACLLSISLGAALCVPCAAYEGRQPSTNTTKSMKAYQKRQKKQMKKTQKAQKKAQKRLQKLHAGGQ